MFRCLVHHLQGDIALLAQNSMRFAMLLHTLTLCVPCIILQCVNEQRHAQFGTIVQACLHDCTDCTKLSNTVYYAVLLVMNDWIRSKHVEQKTVE